MSPKTEQSPLLPTSTAGNGSGHNGLTTNGDSPETTQIKRTTHNDPTIKDVSEDMGKLYGSTLMMKNAREREKAAHEHAHQHSDFYNEQAEHAAQFLKKVRGNFFEDARSMAEGTIPQSVAIASVVGVVCGIAAFFYYKILFFLLEFLWTTLPEKYVVGNWSEDHYWMWIPLVSFTMLILTGLAVVVLGEPGDLPYTISRVHQDAYIPMDHVPPMIVASMFSILAGGSLGPEAPLGTSCDLNFNCPCHEK